MCQAVHSIDITYGCFRASVQGVQLMGQSERVSGDLEDAMTESSDVNSTDSGCQGGHRYASSDAELVGYFLSSLGVKGQSYEALGGADFNSDEAAARMLKAFKFLQMARSPMQWFDSVTATLMKLSPEHRITLTLVYTPHSWPATWMASALSAPWGSGSMAALALTLPGATSSEDGGISSETVRRWLLDVDRPSMQEVKRRESVCARLVRIGELRLDKAMGAYDALRVARVLEEEREAREKRVARQAANEARLAEELGMDRRIARARLERRTRRAA